MAKGLYIFELSGEDGGGKTVIGLGSSREEDDGDELDMVIENFYPLAFEEIWRRQTSLGTKMVRMKILNERESVCRFGLNREGKNGLD